MKTLIPIIIQTLAIISCNNYDSGHIQDMELDNKTTLNLPKIYDTLKITGKRVSDQEMSQAKYNLQLVDTFGIEEIDVTYKRGWDEFISSPFEDLNWHLIDENSLKIIVDTSQIISAYKDWKGNYPPEPPPPNNDISEQFEKKFNKGEEEQKRNRNNKDNYYQYLPVYILNNSDKHFSIILQDIYGIVMIQEAKNEIGEWKPIQFWNHNWCGNAYHTIPLKPEYFAFTRVPYFRGQFTTELRLKMNLKGNIYYSNSYIGSINKSQFNVPKVIQKENLKKFFLDRI